MINATHFVLDLETMSTAPDAAIAAIGCVRVELGIIVDEFYERVDLESARAMGGVIDTPTLQWWLTQPQEARQEVSGELPGTHITTALGKLTEFMHRGGLTDDQPLVWGNGSSFDNVILASAYQRAGFALPWKFWHDRDLRTLLALYPQAKQTVQFEGTKHHALNDARHEARQLIAAIGAHAAVTGERDALRKDRDECVDARVHYAGKLGEATAECDQLRAQVESLRKQAALEVAVQRAAGELPDGWEIHICIEKDGGAVELFDSEGNEVEYPSDHERLACDVRDAIEAALTAEEA